MASPAKKRQLESSDASEERNSKAPKVAIASTDNTDTSEPLEDLTEADDILHRLSLQDLQTFVRELLFDPQSGPAIKDKLLRCSDAALANCRSQAQELYEDIMADASDAISEVYRKVQKSKRCASSSAWPDALYHFLPRAKELLELGPIANGPELAWKALLELARLCIVPVNADDCRFQEGEEQCDEFQSLVDVLLLDVCQIQEKAGNLAWLSEERSDELRQLAEEAGEVFLGGWRMEKRKCSDYRYRRTLKFLGRKRPSKGGLAIQDLCC